MRISDWSSDVCSSDLLLFGLLNGVRTSFAEAGQSANGAERLQTGSRLSFIQTLPISLLQRIRQVDGVRDVTYANWFGGAYQDQRNQIFSLAVAPNYLDLYPEIEVSAAEREAVARPSTGVLVGEVRMKRCGWKDGNEIPRQAPIFLKRNETK